MRDDTKAYLLTLLAFMVGAMLAILFMFGMSEANASMDGETTTSETTLAIQPDLDRTWVQGSESTTTTATSPTSTRPQSTLDSGSELPYTGAGLVGLTVLATSLMAGGLALVRKGAASDS